MFFLPYELKALRKAKDLRALHLNNTKALNQYLSKSTKDANPFQNFKKERKCSNP